jgi:hypothetical protein
LAAIDDIIERGNREDWNDLRDAVLADKGIAGKVWKVAATRQDDPDQQRHHFWRKYVERKQKVLARVG